MTASEAFLHKNNGMKSFALTRIDLIIDMDKYICSVAM